MLRGFRQKMQERSERKEQERQEAAEQARLAWQTEQEERRRQQEVRDRVLAIIREGKVPEMDIQRDSVPFKLQRTEKMLLAVENVPYSEMRVKREIQGRSAGASVRVAKGMSVRVGGSRGTPKVKSRKWISKETPFLSSSSAQRKCSLQSKMSLTQKCASKERFRAGLLELALGSPKGCQFGLAAPAALLWRETCLRRAGTGCSAFPQSMSFSMASAHFAFRYRKLFPLKW